ncbi:MAG: hypothetical protein KGH81_07795, partial [Thaumarchaeota archaeon]|nr:hypothetical protein [Nitrososphaerota archaeon]
MDWATKDSEIDMLAGAENRALLARVEDVLRDASGVPGDAVGIDLGGRYAGWVAWCLEYPPKGWRVVARAPAGDRFGARRVVPRVEFFGAGAWPDTWATKNRGATRQSTVEAVGLARGAWVAVSPSGDSKLALSLGRVEGVDGEGRPTLVALCPAKEGAAPRVLSVEGMTCWPVPEQFVEGARLLWEVRSSHGVFANWRWFTIRASSIMRKRATNDGKAQRRATAAQRKAEALAREIADL